MESDQIQAASAKPENQPSPRRALGRGLEALLPAAAPAEAIRRIPVSQIDPNPYQARRHFHPERLREMAESIRAHGVVQPVVVRKAGERFLLIAGERRLRATILAGSPSIPAIVREVAEKEVLELTLIENIQREDLNPIEVAEAFARLAREASMTHEQIAARTGKDRATVTNFLRLLKLPAEVRERLDSGELSMGHARALLTLPTEAAQKALAARIIALGLSVRQTEALAKSAPGGRAKTLGSLEKEALRDPNVQAAIQEMERALGARVRIVGNDLQGKIVIEYHSDEDLDRIYHHIVRSK
jgi:ParB family chromosome partitioning protein